MNKPNVIIRLCFLFTLLLSNGVVALPSKLNIVTSFSILEDLVRELGGEHVNVISLVGRNSDAHTYQPKPSDAVAISKADLVIYNGLEFEGWITRLLHQNGTQSKTVIASEGVDAIIHGDETDPHAWQSFNNIYTYINNITNALVDLLPAEERAFVEYQQRYVAALKALELNLAQQINKIPTEERIVVTSHDAFGYLEREYDIQFLAPHGVNLEVEATAADVATVIQQIREKNVSAIFVENITNPKLLERISEETKVAIGGRLFSDALSEAEGPANTYINMMKHNIESLLAAFNSSK